MRGFLVWCYYGLALVCGIAYAVLWLFFHCLVKPIAIAAWGMMKLIWKALKQRWYKNTRFFWNWVAKDGWPFILMMIVIGVAIAYVKLWWKK